jgi:hypothetical protein
MNLTCGIIVIGSLYWDSSTERVRWRKTTFLEPDKPLSVSVPIRYGRESKSRKMTFTMVFSNHSSTIPGQGLLLETKNKVKSFKGLLSLASHMALAEGIYKKDRAARLSCDWGTIGLLINPKHMKDGASAASKLAGRWSENYSTREVGSRTEYTFSKEVPVIDQNGILQIPWTRKMAGFDLILSTVTKPTTKYPTAKQIADRIKQTGYDEYFIENRNKGITTFQDEDILRHLTTGAAKHKFK